ncbi:hypothetical protein BDF19DRAFT_430383 [Syncephalis fuscata]|nr:hypothetical protein BDF19DRAFT_430383 [Syncephalis fuscata]
MVGDASTINTCASTSTVQSTLNHDALLSEKPSLPPPPPFTGLNAANRPPAPPRRSTVPDTPYQYSQTGNYRDFRDYNHTEDGHWNDVPTSVLASARKRSGTLPSSDNDEKQSDTNTKTGDSLDVNGLATSIQAILEECTAAIAVFNPTQKRMLEDTKRRMNELLVRLKDNQVKAHILTALSTFLNAINSQDYTTANQVHLDLMQTDFDSEGRWLVGAKRLVELMQTARASA